MASIIFPLLILTTTALTITAVSATGETAFPSYGTTTTDSCISNDGADLIPVRREVYDEGRILDISHRYTPNMPSWGSDDGVGQFLWLPKSMKNGSLANNSEMKLPTHTGTHVDAPGHVYDHYFDAGFDVDTLDLHVLNGTCGELFPEERSSWEWIIFDITHKFTPKMALGLSENCIDQFLAPAMRLKNGSWINVYEIELHGYADKKHTNVHAQGYMVEHLYDAGPALLVDVPRDKNLTAEVMKSLNIPRGVRRVLFRTLNTDRHLMLKKEFDTSYVGFMKDGAQWLVDNTDIKLVGIDYLSVAAYDDLIPSHLAFLEGREIILVEGLKLDDIQAGIYDVHCLPLRLLGAEGSPIRCILIK